MNISTMNLILWGCVIWMPALFYVLLKNETKFKKNIAVGVTFPQEARDDEEVQQILAVFKKHLLYVCVGLFISAIPCIFIPATAGMVMTIWMIWLLLGCVLPYIPYIQCNRKLKQLKEARGWKQASAQMQTVDLRAASVETHWLSPYWFLLPALVSLIPLLTDTDIAIAYLLDALMIVFFWFCYRCLYRNKSEVVDDNLVLTEALTRIRRHHWGRMWLISAWFIAALNLLVWLSSSSASLTLAAILALSLILVIASIYLELKLRKLQETLTAQSGTGFYVDDDDKWIWGIFYHNPHDSRFTVNARVGINATVNLAHPAGKVMMVLVALLVLALPFMGFAVEGGTGADMELRYENGTLTAAHGRREYTVDDIDRAELLYELPEGLMRVMGTGLPNLLKGDFRAADINHLYVCLDPGCPPFLLVQSDGEYCLFGTRDAEVTQRVYESLQGN